MDFQRIDETSRKFQRSHFRSAKGKYDLYAVFVERGLELVTERGEFGYIIQNKFLSSDYGKALKQFTIENTNVRNLLDFEDAPIFGGTTTYPLILTTTGTQQDTFQYVHLRDATERDVVECLRDVDSMSATIERDSLNADSPWIFPTHEKKL
jgi:hypothetical protein